MTQNIDIKVVALILKLFISSAKNVVHINSLLYRNNWLIDQLELRIQQSCVIKINNIIPLAESDNLQQEVL